MPKPTTYQRPIPVNRNRNGRLGGPPPPFGKPGRKPEQPAAPPAKPGLQLDLHLPPLPPQKR